MVCERCISSVKESLLLHNIPFDAVSLGTIDLPNAIAESTLEIFKSDIHKKGFEILTDAKIILVKEIKTALLDLVNSSVMNTQKLSIYLSEKLNTPYQTLSNVFSVHEHITIEKYLILLKIEKAKELLSYQQLTLKEISNILNYSSPAHFSKQFKDITGIPASAFKRNNTERKPLDKV